MSTDASSGDLLPVTRSDHAALVPPTAASVPAPVDGYTEREMRLIFERAGEASVDSERDRRYSLAEIQEIAAQAGLDPSAVARAAATVRTQPGGNRFFGGPIAFRGARVVSREMFESDILETVLRIRERTGLHGDLKDVPGGIEWRAQSAFGHFIVSFARATNGTRIDVRLARPDQAVLTAMGSGFAGIAIGVITAMVVGGVLDAGGLIGALSGAVGAIGSTWGLARLVWRRVARKWSAEAAAITDIVAASMERPTD